MQDDALSIWGQLTNRRRGLERRWEKYSRYTLPRYFTSEHWNEDSDEASLDWQSVGAQGVNHVVNKLMLALFAPSRPFMRLEAQPDWLLKLPPGLQQDKVEEALANAERAGMKELDSLGGTRAKLYQTLGNLVILGNALLYLPPKKNVVPRCYNLRQYAVRRTGEGKVKVLVIRECVKFDELEPDVQQAVNGKTPRHKPDSKVQHFRLITRQEDGSYKMSQYVDKTKLPQKYDGAWSEEAMPYRVLVWNLKDGNHYGTGLVEDYAADFGGLSSLSEATIKGAILASEFRWLVNPAGQTKVEDFEESENGSALPGMEGDIALVANSKPGDLQVVQGVAQDYIQRLGRGFLLSSAVTRNAERVTAEEIRMQAQELETSFGGTYSQIAVDMQLPIARWLLKRVDLTINGKELKLTILTGLDALSRMGDLDALRAALADCAGLVNLKEVMPELNTAAILQTVFAGHGLAAGKYVKAPEQVQAEQQAAATAENNQVINQEAVSAGVAAATEGQQ